MPHGRNPEISLESTDPLLVEGFAWAKTQAFQYVFNDDPVGRWYEASLPGRQAFCMRDVAHQSAGAQLLGLRAHNLNMLTHFAANVAPSRDWCSFWEINKDGKPAPVDYDNDGDFWYNLPANFDVLDCCFRQFMWTGDLSYISDSVFEPFYHRTVTDFVRHWDVNGDGVLEHLPSFGRRGIATYNEALEHPLVGGDMIASQYAGYIAYSNILHLRGQREAASTYFNSAQKMKTLYNATWWDDEHRIFYGLRRQDGTFSPLYGYETNFLPLYFGLVEDGAKTEAALFDLLRHNPPNVEAKSYIPEIFFKYQYDRAGYEALLELLQPDLPRREYPEVSFSVIAALVSGLAGVAPNAIRRSISTLSHLVEEDARLVVTDVPVFDNLVTIEHLGRHQTTFTNQSGSDVHWEACFPGATGSVVVNGRVVPAMHRDGPSTSISFVEIHVNSGQSVMVRVQ